MTRSAALLILIVVVLFFGAGGGVWYWYEYRPSQIVSTCQRVYDQEFEVQFRIERDVLGPAGVSAVEVKEAIAQKAYEACLRRHGLRH